MKKYEIRTDSFEFRLGNRRSEIPAMSAGQILDTYLSCDDQITSNSIDPAVEGSFYTLDAARDTFARHYADYGWSRLEHVGTGYILRGRLAWIEENEYDEEGDFVRGGETYDVSAQPYEAENGEDDE